MSTGVRRADLSPEIEPIEFGLSTARPTTPRAGRVRYETDTSGYVYYDGAAWQTFHATAENVQDTVGAMFSGNTETNVTVTYQDADGTIDVEVPALDLNALTTEASPALTDYVPIVDVSESNASNKTLVTDLLKLVYPVGCLYLSTNSTNPATSLGFGTWSAFGAGRVPVGFDSGQTEFDTDEETGGAKTHTLTTAELPAHDHGSTGAHTHTITGTFVKTTIGSGTRADDGGGTRNSESSGQTANSDGAHTHNSVGGDTAHNNLQPYIVVRMWKRTA